MDKLERNVTLLETYMQQYSTLSDYEKLTKSQDIQQLIIKIKQDIDNLPSNTPKISQEPITEPTAQDTLWDLIKKYVLILNYKNNTETNIIYS